jgi:hypothetical protein
MKAIGAVYASMPLRAMTGVWAGWMPKKTNITPGIENVQNRSLLPESSLKGH